MKMLLQSTAPTLAAKCMTIITIKFCAYVIDI